MKPLIFLSTLLISNFLFSQEKFSKEIKFINDNDLYVSTKNDRYYTNGIFIKYRYLSKLSSEKLEKKIFEFNVGHEMFTPYKSIVTSIEEHDRPFAAYLYGSFGISRVFKSKKIINTTLQIGVIGPNAHGKELQDFIHNIYDFGNINGWKYQINNALGLNFNSEYIKSITKNNSKKIDLFWMNYGRIGTVYTDISSGFLMRIGFKPLASMLNSTAFGTNLNSSETKFTRQVESFLFIKPLVRYAIYDATIQGSFLNNNNLVTKELIPFVFSVSVGIKFTAKRFNFGYTFNYNTNKVKNLRITNGNKYGSISVDYLFR